VRWALPRTRTPGEETAPWGGGAWRGVSNIRRAGTTPGSPLTQAVIERAARVRVTREGAVIYPPAERTASLESLKRFKDDVREVREGFECGMKIAGYDDVKVDDIIECYRIEQVQRTLD